MKTPAADLETRSAECALAARPDYATLHTDCRQTKDIPLPGARGVLLIRRCTCPCHGGANPAGSSA